MRRTAIAFIGSILVATAMTVPARAASTASVPTSPAPVDFHAWHSWRGFRQGNADGVSARSGGLRIAHPIGTARHSEPGLGTTRRYDYARWTSPSYHQGFPATQLVASWNADTPEGTWIEVDMRGNTDAGNRTGWYVMGRWASGDTDIQRTSVAGQSDGAGTIAVDTFQAADGVTLSDYQLRVTLYRKAGTHASPRVRMLGAMTSDVPDRFDVPSSSPGGAGGIELPVPRYSQNIHEGQYPQYDGGGEAWCSPTSTEMVVEYWHEHPTPEQLSWVDPSYDDPSVDYAARNTYDYSYEGAGNWPFNTAYAASYGLSAHVTRLKSLDELERYIQRGIPVVTSLSFRADELTGANYSTAGHLMVIVGFTARGDVIANDPASSDDDAVRNVYRRHQFERDWLRTKRYDSDGDLASGTGGIAYIITPRFWPLP